MWCFHTEPFVLPLPAGHRFPVGKGAMLCRAVRAQVPGAVLEVAPAATDGELALVHTPSYVHAVGEGLLSTAQQRAIGFPWSPQMVERSRRSVGATVAAARRALDEGVAANLAGGTHHAHADHGAGFCVFNDVAVAARLMQAEWHRTRRALLRVLVIDLDVHQGDGTACIFGDDPSVFTLSLHGQRNFPACKQRSDLDLALPDGCGDAEYLAVLSSALDAVDRAHLQAPPGLAFYLAGADPHVGDRLGRLALTEDGLARRDKFVLDWLAERRIPVALSMAGGYGQDLAVTVAIQRRTVEIALAAWQHWRMKQ